ATFSNYPIVLAEMLFLPSEIVVIMHFFYRSSAKDLQHLIHDDVPPGVGIIAGQFQGLYVILSDLGSHIEEQGFPMHRALSGLIVVGEALRQGHETGRGTMPKPARTEVHAHP